MGDNELIEEVVSPTESQSVDLSSIIDSLNDLIVAQGEIIKNQKKIIDYFIPTEEELIQLEKDKQEELEQIEIQEKEIQEKEELKEQQLNDYNAQILTLLEDIYHLYHQAKYHQKYHYKAKKHYQKHFQKVPN